MTLRRNAGSSDATLALASYCEPALRLSAGSCVYTDASIRLFAFSLNKQSRRLRSNFELSSKSCRSDQPTLGLGWHGAEQSYPNKSGPARFHLGTEPSTTRVNIPASADWCLSLHRARQRACGRQRAIRCLKVRSFWRGTNLFSSTSWTCQHVVPNFLAQ